MKHLFLEKIMREWAPVYVLVKMIEFELENRFFVLNLFGHYEQF